MAEKRTATREPVADRLIDTASALFYQEGIQSVGVQRVIDEAGIAKASLYAHFPSKDDLVAACLERRAASWQEIVQREVLDTRLDARDKLLRLFDRLAEWVASEDFRGCPFQNASSELADVNHPARAVVERQRAWFHALLKGLVEEAGLRPVDGVTGALLVLHAGATAAAQSAQSPQPGLDARWAAERIIEAAEPTAPPAPPATASPPDKTARAGRPGTASEAASDPPPLSAHSSLRASAGATSSARRAGR